VTAEYFPVAYSSTVFGACSILSRITTILAPLIAEINDPYPMLIFTCLAFMSAIAMVKLEKNESEMTEKEREAKILHIKQHAHNQ
jgi:fucose permease